MSATRAGTDLDAEVIVVGAGPAGCLLGYLLARSGVETLLVERHGSLDREFRGYLFQPLVLRIFAELGLLDDVLDLPHGEVCHADVVAYDRRYPVIRFDDLPEPYDYGLLMEQPPLLEYLIESADAYEGFSYRDRTPVTDLAVDEGAVVGVEARDRRADEAVELRSRLVVGADGRFSTVRGAAGVDPGLLESALELLWFKLPASAVPGAAQARLADEGLLLYFGLGGDEAQAGWFVEKGTYPNLRRAGVGAFHDRLVAVDPALDGVVQSAVPDFDACSLLRIEPGLSERWVRDGLLLIGDAAHVASPVGAQGNSLAVQDAVVAHPAIVGALGRDRSGGPIPATSLRAVERRRRDDVERVLRAQRRGERILTAVVRGWPSLPRRPKRALVRAAFPLFPHLPGTNRVRDLLAFGAGPVSVDSSPFVDGE